MRISDAMQILQHYLDNYGDCKVMGFYAFTLSEVCDFKFIGGQRLLVVCDDEFEQSMWDFYTVLQKGKMKSETQEWLKDCEDL